MMKFNLIFCLLLYCCAIRADNTVMEVVPLQNRPAAELIPLLTPVLESSDKVVADGANLIIKTTPEKMADFLKLIASLDVAVNNLIISVIQNSTKTAAELNAEAIKAINPPAIEMHGMNADTRDLVGNQIMHVQTLDGHQALIKLGNVKSSANVSIYGMNGRNQGLGVSMPAQQTGSGFAVTPRLTGRQVVLDIEPWAENDQQGYSKQTQAIHSSIRANLGEWLEIAGNGGNNVQDTNGMNGLNYSIHKNNLRILLKVDVEGGFLLYPNLQNTHDQQR